MQLSEATLDVKFHCLVQKSEKKETRTLVPVTDAVTKNNLNTHARFL